MLPGFLAYVVALGMLTVCGLIALTLIRTVNGFDGAESPRETANSPSMPHADAA